MKKDFKDNRGVTVIEIILVLSMMIIPISIMFSLLMPSDKNSINSERYERRITYSCDEIKKIVTVNHYKTGNSDISIEDMKILKKQCNID